MQSCVRIGHWAGVSPAVPVIDWPCHPERSARMVFPTRVFCESGGHGVEGSAVRWSGRAWDRSIDADYICSNSARPRDGNTLRICRDQPIKLVAELSVVFDLCNDKPKNVNAGNQP